MDNHWDKKTQLRVIEDLYKVRIRHVDPEAMENFEVSELDFVVSSTDLLHNLIEVRRAKRAHHLAMMGHPSNKNMRIDKVSELESTLFLYHE